MELSRCNKIYSFIQFEFKKENIFVFNHSTHHLKNYQFNSAVVSHSLNIPCLTYIYSRIETNRRNIDVEDVSNYFKVFYTEKFFLILLLQHHYKTKTVRA